MKFKVDENLPIEVGELLRQAGHDAATVLEQHLSGRADSDVALACQREGRILVTLDLDFADIRTYPPVQYPGLIVLRLKQQDKPHALEILSRRVGLSVAVVLGKRTWFWVEREPDGYRGLAAAVPGAAAYAPVVRQPFTWNEYGSSRTLVLTFVHRVTGTPL